MTAKFKKIFLKTEYKVVFYITYIVSLAVIFCLFLSKGLLVALMGVLIVHLFFVFIISLLSFGKQLIYNFIFPLVTLVYLINNFQLRRYFKNFSKNSPLHTVIVLGHSNWLRFRAWTRPNFFLYEIKSMVEYLEKMGNEFSFYPNASIKDVHDIMSNKGVKEVYFFGHGDSHTFCLGTDELLYYCDFNKNDHSKDFVHQVHCGTPDGTSLIDYVVPEENKNKCFFFRKEINGPQIVKEFKKRTDQLSIGK